VNPQPHSIFRPEAIRRYRQNQQASVLPRFTRPPVLTLLWVLLGLLGAGGVIAWLVTVPEYAVGQAIVVQGTNLTRQPGGDVQIVAFLPSGYLPRLRPGQSLFVQLDQSQPGGRVKRPIHEVEPNLCSPETAQKRFASGLAAAGAITRPAAVVIARWEPGIGGLPGAAYLGSVLPVEVKVGSRRMLSLLPFISALLERSAHDKL
jgi:hypothetical protein